MAAKWRVNLDGDEWQTFLPDIFKPGEEPGTSKITCDAAEVLGHFVLLTMHGISLYIPAHKVRVMFSFEGKAPAGFLPD